MRERPILFNTEMVKAILAGRKTCTRRLVKFLPWKNPQWTGYIRDGLMLYNGRNEPCIIKVPYQPGDTLYVRETWCGLPVNEAGHMRGHTIYYYKADGELRPKGWRGTWHLRVERLQEITSEQICREGVEVEYPHVLNGEEKRYAFSRLWDSTIKKSDLDRYGWNASPWVWVIEFERCEKPEGV